MLPFFSQVLQNLDYNLNELADRCWSSYLTEFFSQGFQTAFGH